MGKLIIMEGLDGSGKGTQAELLAKSLTEQGKTLRKVTFPDYASDSSALVRMYLAGKFGDRPDDVNAYAASSFFSVDRYAAIKPTGGSFTAAAGWSFPTGTPPATRCISAPSCRRNSGIPF